MHRQQTAHDNIPVIKLHGTVKKMNKNQAADQNNPDFNEEIEDLRNELARFKKEKERVRAIVGHIGGMPTENTKIWNIIFILVILATLVISLATEGGMRLAMVELAVTALSIKLLLLMNTQSRVNHFQLWILSSIEWRLNEIRKDLRGLAAKSEKNSLD